MSDTPRTDAARDSDNGDPFHPFSLCRDLERELAQSIEANAGLMRACDKLERELSAANAKIAELEKPFAIDCSEQAFPGVGSYAPGMSLRDWFAGMALQGMLASMNTDETTSGLCVAMLGGLSDFQAAMAAAAYGYSDTMILAGKDASFSSYPEQPVSLQTAADRPIGSISRIHQRDAKACCDMLSERKGGA